MFEEPVNSMNTPYTRSIGVIIAITKHLKMWTQNINNNNLYGTVMILF